MNRAFTLLLASLVGCASGDVVFSRKDIAPRTYAPESASIERSVGLLRRLLVLPIVLQVSPEDPKLCVDPCNWDALRRDLANGAHRYLADQRGYVVLSVDPRVFSPAGIGVAPEELEAAARKLATFAKTRQTGAPPVEIATLVQELGKRADVDGVVVVQGSVTVINWIDWAAAYATFGMSMPTMLRAQAVVEGDVFEVKHGYLAWVGSYHAFAGGQPPAITPIVNGLFDRIEPALPAVFARPPSGNTGAE
jgi:hypothetical protein